MNTKYYNAVFKRYSNGYYTFVFDSGFDMVFEEIHPKVLSKYNLKQDETLKGKSFHLAFSENLADDEDDFIIYRIEYLELINQN